jgi:hypothetical protein
MTRLELAFIAAIGEPWEPTMLGRLSLPDFLDLVAGCQDLNLGYHPRMPEILNGRAQRLRTLLEVAKILAEDEYKKKPVPEICEFNCHDELGRFPGFYDPGDGSGFQPCPRHADRHRAATGGKT